MSLLAQATRLGLRRLNFSNSRCFEELSRQRFFSAGPSAPEASGADDDIVLETFKQGQKSYRAVLEGLKKIPVPLNGDEAALNKFVNEVESLKQKAGMPPMYEVVGATLSYQLKVARGNVRKFLTSATEGVDLGDYSVVVDEMLKAVDDIEAKTGAPLDASNEKGWKELQKRVEAIQKQHGLDDLAKVKKDSIMEMYKIQLENIKEQAVETMEAAKRRDGLEFIEVDVAKLQPKL
ncbi:probable ATP synthase 24 kDa subunit, mitochondrial [Coccomyxa sp. Obi]|nr:probable ATP synthase 24 kDa subunit, mitochondrial [Coccomyxa sp. Obi]